MSDEILNVSEAAKHLGVERTTLWRMYSKYKMIAPPVRFSIEKTGHLRSYLDGWMKERMEDSSQIH